MGAFMDYYAIGQRVRRFRKAQNLSQEQLAEMVNISTTHMSHIETGNTKLSLQVFCDLASALHVSADDLLFDGRPSGKAVCTQEIANLLSRCSPSQAQDLKDLLFAAKQSDFSQQAQTQDGIFRYRPACLCFQMQESSGIGARAGVLEKDDVQLVYTGQRRA